MSPPPKREKKEEEEEGKNETVRAEGVCSTICSKVRRRSQTFSKHDWLHATACRSSDRHGGTPIHTGNPEPPGAHVPAGSMEYLQMYGQHFPVQRALHGREGVYGGQRKRKLEDCKRYPAGMPPTALTQPPCQCHAYGDVTSYVFVPSPKLKTISPAQTRHFLRPCRDL